jgi:pre-rRNA-processing protein TSR1
MSKIDRKNQAKQKAQQKQRLAENEAKKFTGRSGAPRVVAVISLGEDSMIDESGLEASAIKDLLASVDSEVEYKRTHASSYIERFKKNMRFIPVRNGLLLEALAACRSADYILFALPATGELQEHSQHLLSCIAAQGMTNTFAAVKVRP